MCTSKLEIVTFAGMNYKCILENLGDHLKFSEEVSGLAWYQKGKGVEVHHEQAEEKASGGFCFDSGYRIDRSNLQHNEGQSQLG